MKERAAIPGVAVLVVVAAVAAGCGGGRSTRTTTGAPPPSERVTTGRTTTVPASPAVPPGDARMMIHAAQDSLAEIRLGQVAQRQAGSDDVRQLGQRLIADHTRASETLRPLAAQGGVMLSQALDPQHQAAEQELSRLSGQAFDVAYLEHMIGDHARAIAMFERMAATAGDPALRAWAEQQLPVLRQHQAATQSLHAQVAGTPPAASPPTTR
jgi:putative membrane protein